MSDDGRSCGPQLPALLLLGVVVLFGVGCSNASRATEDASVLLLEQHSERATEAFGVVFGKRSQNIRLDMPAKVVSVHVTEAQHVNRGDVLIALDLTEYGTILAVAENKLAKERLALRQMKETLARDHERTVAELKRLRIGLQTARAEADKARADYLSEQRLGHKSVKHLDQLRLSADSMERHVATLELKLEEIHVIHDQQVEVLRDIGAPQFDGDVLSNPHALAIEIQRKTLETIEIEVADLKRSWSGPHLQGPLVVVDMARAVVSDLTVRAGDRVDRGDLLLRLIDLDSLAVEAHVAEEFIRDVQLQDPVTIIPLAAPNRHSSGSVIEVSGMAVYRSGETIVPVLISIDDNQGMLLPNFNVDVIIRHD